MLSRVIERNIRTIIYLRTKATRERGLEGRIADAITSFSGRMIFAYVHILWKPGRKMYWLKSTVFRKLSSKKGNQDERSQNQPGFE